MKCPENCPIPICKLPKVLSVIQINTIITYKDLCIKEIASELGISTSTVYNLLDKYNNNVKARL